MAVSNNSVVHYTRSLAAVRSIIKEKSFRVKYCTEIIKIINGSTIGQFEIAIPMVCFCDIPFKNVDLHTKEYGNYGIGLSKKWATRNGLNPVIYLEKKSRLTGIMDSIYYLGSSLNNELTEESEDHITYKYKNINKYLEFMLGYIKNYCDDLYIKRDKRTIKDYVFYNEREWRFVARDDQGLKRLVDKTEYESKKDFYNELAKNQKLEFDYDDITYIVLEKKDQIDRFVKYLENNTNIDIRSICSKIITLEQIRSDF